MTDRARSTALTGGVAILVAYVSLFPFQFGVCRSTLFLTSILPVNRGDFISNVLLYAPLGLFGARVFGAPAATLAGAALAFAIEAAQQCIPGRVPVLGDIAANTLGTWLGAMAAVRLRFDFESVLMVCWIGGRLLPYIPSVHPAKYFTAIKAIAASPDPMELSKYFALWLAASVLLERRVVAAIAIVIAGRILIIDLTVSSAELLGAALAAVTALFLKERARVLVASGVVAIYVVANALEPLHFLSAPRPFGWIPFLSFMQAPRESASRVFLEKSFMYGMLVWLPVRAGLPLGLTAVLGTALVFSVRLEQVYVPSRSAEITDALMVVLLAAAMKLTRR